MTDKGKAELAEKKVFVFRENQSLLPASSMRTTYRAHNIRTDHEERRFKYVHVRVSHPATGELVYQDLRIALVPFHQLTLLHNDLVLAPDEKDEKDRLHSNVKVTGGYIALINDVLLLDGRSKGHAGSPADVEETVTYIQQVIGLRKARFVQEVPSGSVSVLNPNDPKFLGMLAEVHGAIERGDAPAVQAFLDALTAQGKAHPSLGEDFGRLGSLDSLVAATRGELVSEESEEVGKKLAHALLSLSFLIKGECSFEVLSPDFLKAMVALAKKTSGKAQTAYMERMAHDFNNLIREQGLQPLKVLTGDELQRAKERMIFILQTGADYLATVQAPGFPSFSPVSDKFRNPPDALKPPGSTVIP